MYLQADVHCYHCGDTPGSWEWRVGYPANSGQFRPNRGHIPRLGQLAGLRCGRCQGPVYLDDVRPRPQQRPPFAYERARRGRPPKSRDRLSDSLFGNEATEVIPTPLAG
jgi:hypothetical protein